MNEEKIEKLWDWFSANEKRIRDCMENDSAIERDYVVENLDNLILDMGVFSWQIGQGIHKPWYLTISPNGDIELIKKSRKIIASAPDHSNWEFHYCKPAKDWDRQFSIYDDDMIKQTINASDWKYVALHHEDGLVELILEAKNIAHLDNDTARTAADLVVINEIGEEAKILSLSSIDIVDQLDQIYDSRKAEINKLRRHFIEIRSKL